MQCLFFQKEIWSGRAPPKGTEVSLRRFPRQVSQYDLCPVLSKVRIIYTLRLMMDFLLSMSIDGLLGVQQRIWIHSTGV